MDVSGAAQPLAAADRLLALSRSGLMGDGPDPAMDHLTDMVRRVLGIEAVVLNLLDDTQQFCVAAADADSRIVHGDRVPLGNTFCERVIISDQLLVVDDVRQHGWQAGLAMEDGAAAYAGIPVRAPGGTALGVLCGISRRPRRWTDADIGMLQRTADTLATEIRLRDELQARRRSEQALLQSEARLRLIFQASALGISVIDGVGRLEEVNPALTRILCMEQAALQQRTLLSLALPEDYRQHRPAISAVVRGIRPFAQADLRFRRGDGGTVWVRFTASVLAGAGYRHRRLLALWEDISHQRYPETELRARSSVDELTGLLNRHGFMAAAAAGWELARSAAQDVVLLFVDLDGFAQIRDTWGHSAGDAALRELGACLQRSFREQDMIARLDDAGFVVMALVPPDQQARLRDRVMAMVATLNRSGKLPFQMSVSLGVMRATPVSGGTLLDMLHQADAEVYRAKPGLGFRERLTAGEL